MSRQYSPEWLANAVDAWRATAARAAPADRTRLSRLADQAEAMPYAGDRTIRSVCLRPDIAGLTRSRSRKDGARDRGKQ